LAYSKLEILYTLQLLYANTSNNHSMSILLPALASAAKITLIALFRKLFAIVIMFLPVLALPAVARACSVYWVDGGPALYHVGYIRFTETNLSRISQVSHIKPFQKIIRINQPCHYQPSGSMLRLHLFYKVHLRFLPNT